LIALRRGDYFTSFLNLQIAVIKIIRVLLVDGTHLQRHVLFLVHDRVLEHIATQSPQMGHGL
jgi:hypothetical protein